MFEATDSKNKKYLLSRQPPITPRRHDPPLQIGNPVEAFRFLDSLTRRGADFWQRLWTALYPLDKSPSVTGNDALLRQRLSTELIHRRLWVFPLKSAQPRNVPTGQIRGARGDKAANHATPQRRCTHYSHRSANNVSARSERVKLI